MIPNCYFCQHELEPLRIFAEYNDNPDNYTRHFACYNCPRVQTTRRCSTWQSPCCVIMEETGPRCIYLYFERSKLWMNTFLFQPTFIDIKNTNGRFLTRIHKEIGVFNIPPDVMENRIKTWVLFS